MNLYRDVFFVLAPVWGKTENFPLGSFVFLRGNRTYEDAENEVEEKTFFHKLSCDMRWGRGTDGDGNKLRECPEAPRVGA